MRMFYAFSMLALLFLAIVYVAGCGGGHYEGDAGPCNEQTVQQSREQDCAGTAGRVTYSYDADNICTAYRVCFGS